MIALLTTMAKRTLIITAVIVVLIAIGASAAYITLRQGGEELKEEEPALTLSDYPELFEEEVLIVVGENASQVEQESAQAIAAKLKELTENEPIIKDETEVSEEDKRGYNLILIGTPDSNNLLQEVYEVRDATKVTKEYPGENKGILEILRNPWNSDKILLIVAGSNEWGVKGASIILTHRQKTKGLRGEMMVTGNFISVVGRIVIAGNEPFSWPAIETNNTLYGLIDRHELMKLHGKRVPIEGYLTSSRSPYYPAETNINIVSVRVLP